MFSSTPPLRQSSYPALTYALFTPPAPPFPFILMVRYSVASAPLAKKKRSGVRSLLSKRAHPRCAIYKMQLPQPTGRVIIKKGHGSYSSLTGQQAWQSRPSESLDCQVCIFNCLSLEYSPPSSKMPSLSQLKTYEIYGRKECSLLKQPSINWH